MLLMTNFVSTKVHNNCICIVEPTNFPSSDGNLMPYLCGFGYGHGRDDYKEIWHMDFYPVTNNEHDMEKLLPPHVSFYDKYII